MKKREVRNRLHERLTALAEHQGEVCPCLNLIEGKLRDLEYKILLEWLEKAPAVGSPEYAAMQEKYVAQVDADTMKPILLPPRHAQQTVEYSNKEWSTTFHGVSKKLAKQEDAMFALLGSRGTGKTQMAVELIRFMARHGAERATKPENLEQWAWEYYYPPSPKIKGFALYSNTMDFFLRLRKTYEKGSSEHENDVLDEFIRPSLLILDEAHDRRESDWENKMFTYLINRRYQTAGKQTIFIANQTPEEFVLAIGCSIADRLQECGGVIECNWQSFRAGQ